MGFFDKLVSKVAQDYGVAYEKGKVYAPIEGKYIPLDKIPDPVFSQGVLGQGCGIEPGIGEVLSPVDGRIVSVADTKHAVGIEAANGAELLIHVGMDTVEMNGQGFDVKVKNGDAVKAGQPLMTFDISTIREAGHPTTTAFVVTNTDECTIDLKVGTFYPAKTEFGTIEKK